MKRSKLRHRKKEADRLVGQGQAGRPFSPGKVRRLCYLLSLWSPPYAPWVQEIHGRLYVRAAVLAT